MLLLIVGSSRVSPAHLQGAAQDQLGNAGAGFNVQVGKDLANPATHPDWGTEFFAGPAQPAENDSMRVHVPAMGGEVLYRVEADTERGLIDLYFASPSGEPMGPPLPARLLHNGHGVDVLWTLTRFHNTPDERWEEGLASMERELLNLKKRHEQ